MDELRVSYVDVFGQEPLRGNPVAVVHSAQDLSDEQMVAFARWTNLSETTFLLPPTQAKADYRIRIFTPKAELPFAGHPTLGSAHAWLEAGGQPQQHDTVIQECGLGLVEVRRDKNALAFAAPEFVRSGEVEAATQQQILTGLGLVADQVHEMQWIDNGPGWIGVHVINAATVLAIDPDFLGLGHLELGVLGGHSAADRQTLGCDVEVRAFCPGLAIPEDPVTGSLNAGFGVWLGGSGALSTPYVARQGTAMGRDGRVLVNRDEHGRVWVGGTTFTMVRGRCNSHQPSLGQSSSNPQLSSHKPLVRSSRVDCS